MNNIRAWVFGAMFTVSGIASAATIDLVSGNSGSVNLGTANETIFNWVDAQTTGTGVIEPFLRVQNNTGTEQGYNTDLASNDNPWQTKAGKWTHDLLLSDLTTVYIDDVAYYEFLLDLNENNNSEGRYISLNDVQLFTRATGISSVEEDLSILGTKRYGMDDGADGDVTVELDYSRNHGSGSGDMLMYILASNFDGAAATDYVYFYTMFGIPNDVDSGFEEWALRECTESDTISCSPPPEVPLPGTLGLLGLGLAGLGAVRRRKEA